MKITTLLGERHPKNARSLVLLMLTVIGGLSWGFNRTFLVAEQSSPASPVKSVEPFHPSSGETPSSPIIEKEPDDVRNDPLYQSILEQLKEGRAALLSTEHPSSQDNATDSPAGPTTAEWHAIESILRAARILEREEMRKAESRKAKPVDDRSSIPNQLRSLALKIIQSRSNK